MAKKKHSLVTAYKHVKQHQLTDDDKRNLRLGGIVSVYGIMFAVEKFFLVIGDPIADCYWLLIYGALALLATYWWIDDYIRDLFEKHNKE